MLRRPPRSPRTDTLFPYPTLFRSQALRRSSRESFGYAPSEGIPALREAIARHVAFARAVACRADDVIVTSGAQQRSEEHTSELQSLMRISYAVFCLKKKKKSNNLKRYIQTLTHLINN